MSNDLDRISKALTYLPAECRYHGSDFDFLGFEPWLRSMHAVESGLRAEVDCGCKEVGQ